MGHEQQIITLRAINTGLQKIARDVDGGKIPEPHSAEARQLMARLASWQAQATNIARAAQSAMGLAEISTRRQRKTRGPGSFAARQSFASRSTNATTIIDACEVAVDTCIYILDRLGRNAVLQLAGEGAQLIQKALEGQSHELTHVIQQDGGGAVPPPPPSPGGAAMGGVGVVFVLAAALALLRIRMGGSSK